MDRETDIPANAVFVKHEEVKQTVGGRKVLKVFLIDKAGSKHLAAIAEDLGDAHYIYRSTKPFSKYGTIESHNRKELIQWLERVMRESSGNGEGAHLGADEQNPEGVYFVESRQERAHYPDGRRCVRWYLMDQRGESHLAVIGIERDTKDGHYSYTAEEPFASIAPLHCSNQAGVYKWLEKMVTHHTGLGDGSAPSAISGGSALSGLSGDHDGGAGGGRKPPLVISLSAILSAKKSHAALKSLEQATIVDGAYRAKPKPKADSGKAAAAAAAVAATSTQKHKAVGIVQQIQIKKARKLQEDILAEEQKLVQTHLARLRRVAKAEVEHDTAAKATTLGWLHGSVKGDVAEHLDHWLELLQAVLDIQQQQQDADASAAKQQPSAAATPAAATPAAGVAAGAESDVMVWVRQPENRRHHLRVVIECLKELAGTDLPARELINRKVIALVQRCLCWPHQAVVAMAQHMVQRWQWQLAGHMHVLTCPSYMEDHLGLLEDEIAYGLVPLPQLPKHKQALLNTPIPKLVPESHKTPAPAKQSTLSSSSYQQQPPVSAPAALNHAAAAAAAAAVDFGANQQLGRFALQGFNSAHAAAAGGFSGSGAFVAPMGALTPAAGAAASPGFYLPQGFAGSTPGGLVPGSGSSLPGMQVLQGVQGVQGLGSGGVVGAVTSGSMKGTGSRGLPGVAATTATVQGCAGKMLFAAPAAAASGRLPAAPAAGMYAGQQGVMFYNDATAAGAYGGAWQGSGMFAGAAAAGSGGGTVMPGAQASDSTAGAAGSGMGVGFASGSSTDLAALGGDSSGAANAAQQQQQQQLAVYAMQQQQQLRLAGVQQAQYAQAMQQQLQHGGNAAAAAVAMDPQQRQQQWQQQQQVLYWQQQQQMQSVWGQGGALVQQQQQPQGSAGQVAQQASSQGYAHQTQ